MLRKILLISFVVIFGIQTSFSQDGKEDVTNVGIRNLKNNVYLLVGRGGNSVFSAGEDGIFMVDAQFGNMSNDIVKSIARVSDQPVKYIVNTNYQAANTGGNANFVKEGAVVIAHKNTRERVRLTPATVTRKVSMEDLPTMTFSGEMNFYFNNNQIKAFHVFDAYSDGDLAVYFEKLNILHTGDAFYKGLYPYIDFSGGGTLKGYMRGLETLSQFVDGSTIIVPGKGQVANANDLKYTLNMLNIMYKQAEKAIRAGASEDDFAARTDLTERYDDNGFGKGEVTREMFLRGIYQEVKNPDRIRKGDIKAQRAAKKEKDQKGN